MKKRLLFVFLLAVMIVSVAMVFVACNGNNTPGPSKTYSVNVQYDEPEERIWINLISSVYYGAVPEGTDLKYHVQLRNDCVASSVKIYANGNPVTLDLIAGADDYEYIDEGIRDIGEFTLKNVKEDTVITYEYEEVQIKVNLILISDKDDAYSQPTGEQMQIFNGLSFDGDNHSLSYYASTNTPYYTTYSQITDDYTLDGKPKTSGYLAVKSANTVNGAYRWDNFDVYQGSSQMLKAFMYIPGEEGNLFNDWSRCSNNTFFVGLYNFRYKYEEGGTIYDSNSYYREMNITVNPSAIFDNPDGGFDSLGDVFQLTKPDLAFGDFDLGNNPQGGITFTLDQVEGVDYTNAEVYVWDTLIEPVNGVYTIKHAPMYYVSEPGDFDLRTDYKLYLKNVDYSQASSLYVLDIGNNNAKVTFENIGGNDTYYLDDSVLVMRPDSAVSSLVSITFRYYFDSSEDVMNITGEYINLLFNVKVNGTEKLAFDLDNFLPNTDNAKYDPLYGKTVCKTGTDVEVLYTGPIEGTTITDESGTVTSTTYLFDITVSFAIAGGENSFVISGN